MTIHVSTIHVPTIPATPAAASVAMELICLPARHVILAADVMAARVVPAIAAGGYLVKMGRPYPNL
jgi:hypothetical protein